MNTTSRHRWRLLLPFAAIAALSACATRAAPTSSTAAAPAAVEDVEPLPAGIKPLTVEQEEAVGDAVQ